MGNLIFLCSALGKLLTKGKKKKKRRKQNLQPPQAPTKCENFELLIFSIAFLSNFKI